MIFRQAAVALLALTAIAMAQSIESEIQRLQPKADAGDVQAQVQLGDVYRRLGLSAGDMANARNWYGKAAAQGDALGMYNLGLLLRLGRGGPADIPRAVDLFRKAVASGVAAAMTDLGLMYAEGAGVGQNHGEAARLFRMAAEKGDARGMTALGLAYLNGEGVEKSEAESANWLRKGAAGGSLTAQAELGIRLLPHESTESEGRDLLAKAAERGHQHSQYALGVYYMRKISTTMVPVTEGKMEVIPEFSNATRWLSMAANGQHAESQFLLGQLHTSAPWGSRDEGIRWLERAATQGHAAAAKMLDTLKPQKK